MTRKALYLLLFAILLIFAAATQARTRLEDYALVLETPPVAHQIRSREALQSAEAHTRMREILAAQGNLQQELARRKIRVTGSVQLLLNAVFVRIPLERAAELRGLKGVARVAYLPPIRRHLDRAVQLVKAPDAWNVLGGTVNAGAGVKIGILDTGIDQNHPAFRDPSLSMPAGFPKGPDNQLYTNNKVIVARSYVSLLSDTNPQFSTPDDTTPRDRSGHGTAVAMIAAGVRNSGPAATITGVAPKAYLGNYKIFGTPGIHDTTLAPALIQALQDAVSDGMDIVVMALGNPAVYGPLDRDVQTCGGDCDVRAQAVENAVRMGLVVVISAGNDGATGAQFPALNTINTPGTAPSAITAGAATNSHIFFSSVRAGSGPSINALFGDGPRPSGTLTAPLRDVAKLQDDGHACSPLTNGSLSGAIALIQRGNCSFNVKVNNAQQAGAVGAVIYQLDGVNSIIPMEGLVGTGIPAVMIGNTDGLTLKNYAQSNQDGPVTIDPALQPRDAQFNTVADFSSRGPSIGESGIKPEVVAVGTDLYTATQKLDPYGDLYDSSGYTAVSGTSFAAPMVAGAAAMVKQRYPNFRPAQIKSAVVNTATSDVTDNGAPASVTAVGAGKLNAGAAVTVGATVEPATLALATNRTLTITNTGNAATTFNLAVSATNSPASLSTNSLILSPGQAGTVNVTPPGSSSAGSYEGAITISGGNTNLRVPYFYLVGDGISYNIFPIIHGAFTGVVKDVNWLVGFKLVDRYGVPVQNAPVRFHVVSGGGSIGQGDAQTDKLGIAAADVNLGSLLGDQIFTADAGGLTVEFDGFARQLPTITANGVVNAASIQVGKGLAPGSYVAIQGVGLSDATRVANTASLPLALSGVSVSFDGGNLSLPGRLYYVSDKLVSVQVPWEFQGQASVQMKVNADGISSDVYTVPLSDYSPAAFEFIDQASGRQLVAAEDQNYALITPANPAVRGQPIQIYANGLGPVDNQPPTGEPSPGAEPLARTRVNPTVTIGGHPAQGLFSGLAPFAVGLYQLNVMVPLDAPTGIVPIVITANGIDSKPASLPVQ